MLQTVINAFEKDIEKNKDNRMMMVLRDHIIGICQKDTLALSKVETALEKEKSLNGAVDALIKKAKSQAVHNCAVLTDDEVFEFVEHYFGITRLGAFDRPKTATESVSVSVFDLM